MTWIRNEPDARGNVFTVGPRRPHRPPEAIDKTERDWVVVPYLVILVAIRGRVEIERFQSTYWSVRVDRFCRWLCMRVPHKRPWLRVTI